MPLVQVITTVDSEEAARTITNALLEKRAAACVQVLGPVQSTYFWNAGIERAVEWLLIAKTVEEKADEAIDVIKTVHPYAVPEILVVPTTKAYPAYEQWVREHVEHA
ncbi:divalent-cation tolerance protein CutA [Coprothermobacteraceae bacterium]|nr:divalent-cation tolerance protein CutA [Coprothermobacteraceae bacterium]